MLVTLFNGLLFEHDFVLCFLICYFLCISHMQVTMFITKNNLVHKIISSNVVKFMMHDIMMRILLTAKPVLYVNINFVFMSTLSDGGYRLLRDAKIIKVSKYALIVMK